MTTMVTRTLAMAIQRHRRYLKETKNDGNVETIKFVK